MQLLSYHTMIENIKEIITNSFNENHFIVEVDCNKKNISFLIQLKTFTKEMTTNDKISILKISHIKMKDSFVLIKICCGSEVVESSIQSLNTHQSDKINEKLMYEINHALAITKSRIKGYIEMHGISI